MIPLIWPLRRLNRRRQRRAQAAPRGTFQCLEPRTLLSVTNPLDLTALDGATGFQVDGSSDGGVILAPATGAGDFNGDGIDDLIVAGLAPGDSTSGAVYLVLGQAAGFSTSNASLDALAALRIDGLGTELDVAGVGDFNGDGFDDIAIGDRLADARLGAVHVVYGRATVSGVLTVGGLDAADGQTFPGFAGTSNGFGHLVRGLGDIDGDGFDDLAAIEHFRFGRDDESGEVNDELEHLVVIHGGPGLGPDNATVERLGYAIGNFDGGDINGDGFNDLVVADLGHNSRYSSRGIVTVYDGGMDSIRETSGVRVLSDNDRVNLQNADDFGTDMAVAGDFNGDGLDDIAVIESDRGYPREPNRAYVLFGNTDLHQLPGDATTVSGADGFRIVNSTSYGNLFAVDAAGDVDGDGFDDLLIFAGSAESGTAWLLSGGSINGQDEFDVADIDGSNGFRIDNVARRHVHFRPAGDLNGDGFDEFVITTTVDDPDGTLFVVSYAPQNAAGVETQVGGSDADVLTATQGSDARDVLIGGLNNDTLNGDGGPDVLRAGAGDDLLRISGLDTGQVDGGSGYDTLVLDTSEPDLLLSAEAFRSATLGTHPFGSQASGIEAIDLREGTFGVTVLSSVLQISDTNTLRILTDGDDVVQVVGLEQTGFAVADGQFFNIYSDGVRTVEVSGIVSAGDVDGVITVRDSESHDSTVEVSTQDGMLKIEVIVDADDSRATFLHDLADVERLRLELGSGNSLVNLAQSPIPVEVLAGDGNDSITGSRFNDTLHGESGRDFINARGGHDMVFGGPGADMLFGGSQNDYVDGGTGFDRLSGNSGHDVLIGGTGNDRLDGDRGDDRLEGGEGNDRLIGKLGRDSLDGGAGIDRVTDHSGPTVLVDQVAGVVRVSGTRVTSARRDRIVVTEIARLTLEGSDGADEIRVRNFTGPVHLRGGGGNDTLEGAGFSDTLEGGDGDDLLLGKAGGDLLLGGNGDDTVAGAGGLDTISGGSGNDRINGGGGSTVLRETVSGSITVSTSDSAPVFSDGGLGTDTFIGAFTGAQLIGDEGHNRIDASGFAGQVTLLGNDGRDTLIGTDNDDVIDGGIGNDSLIGGAGDDALRGWGGRDDLLGGAGNDVLLGGTGNDTLDGEAGADTVLGEAGADRVTGGSDTDHLAGGGNNHPLDAGDVLTGDPSEMNEAVSFAFDALLSGLR